MDHSTPGRSAAPVAAGEFLPKIVSRLREGYSRADLRADALAGLTVAIVALPLSMGIAISSGLSPERGLFTAIVGGFIISLLGGSRFQVGGPAGAFIVLVASIVERQGYDGLVLATAMGGGFIILAGLLRMGQIVRLVPDPVTLGFSAGIGVIIFAGQLKDLAGLSLSKEPAALVPKLAALASALTTFHPPSFLLSALSLGVILAVRRWRPAWPALLLAVAGAAVLTSLLHLDVATIGSRFGGVPRTLPWPSLPAVEASRLWALLPDALSIALLGAIESLLSAKVADGMANRQHRSNAELVAQGFANIASAAFGGMCATGTIARTATNVRAGARSPIAGMLHAVFILGFMLVAAPLAAAIPLASLAAVLTVVAFNMVERQALMAVLRGPVIPAAALTATLALTVLVDLTTAIAAGCAIAAAPVAMRWLRR